MSVALLIALVSKACIMMESVACKAVPSKNFHQWAPPQDFGQADHL